VEQRHEIGVQDVRVVISELQAENLAAGTNFSEGDFAAEDEFEQIASVEEPETPEEPEIVQEPVEVQLRAVSNEPLAVPDNEPVKPAPRPKKKDSPIITAVPDTGSLDIPVDSTVPANHPDSEDDKSGAAIAVAQPVAAAPAPALEQAHPDVAQAGSGGSADKPVKRPEKGMGVAARAILVILIVSLFVFLGFFAAPQGTWQEWQDRLQVALGGLIATEPASTVGDPGLRPGYEAGEVSEIVLSRSNDELPAATQIIEPAGGFMDDSMELDTGGAQEALETVGDSDFVDILPGNDQVLFVTFAFDSVELSTESQSVLNLAVETLLHWHNSIATITGFSDNQGEDAYNIVLSRQRAFAVEKYLIGEGVEQERLQVEGRGALYDLADAEISVADLENAEYRIVQIRISSDPGATSR
jgi:outer membrane protein OmpA-like peptidoglycan-associated protein